MVGLFTYLYHSLSFMDIQKSKPTYLPTLWPFKSTCKLVRYQYFNCILFAFSYLLQVLINTNPLTQCSYWYYLHCDSGTVGIKIS